MNPSKLFIFLILLLSSLVFASPKKPNKPAANCNQLLGFEEDPILYVHSILEDQSPQKFSEGLKFIRKNRATFQKALDIEDPGMPIRISGTALDTGFPDGATPGIVDHEGRILDPKIFDKYDQLRIALGFTEKQFALICEIYRAVKYREKEREVRDDLLAPDQRAAMDLVTLSRRAKVKVFSGTSINSLVDRQSWITINRPASAQTFFNLALKTLGTHQKILEVPLNLMIGKSIRTLSSEDFTFYADELIDLAINGLKQINSFKNNEIQEGLRHLVYADEFRPRYFRRQIEDLSLGDKCGDCTSLNAVNFGKSLTWQYNPFYQGVVFHSGKRFLGKLTLALSSVDGFPAIIVDSLELNPQTDIGKSYFNDSYLI